MFLTFLAAGLSTALAAPLPDQTALALVPVDYQLPAERVVIYPPEGELRQISGLPLTGSAQRAFDSDFVTSTYFSAFAVSKAGDFGYSTTTNSLDAAQSIALGECQRHAPICTLIAEIVPAGYREPGPGDITITPEVAAIFMNPEGVGAPPGLIRAMAISGDGAYAMVWGHPDMASSVTQVTADCEQNRVNDVPGLAPFPCVVLPGLP